jgi:hypothetical protein
MEINDTIAYIVGISVIVERILEAIWVVVTGCINLYRRSSWKPELKSESIESQPWFGDVKIIASIICGPLVGWCKKKYE